MVPLKGNERGFIPVLISVLVAILVIGSIGIGLAWKTDVLDKWLPDNVKEFFGKEITPTDGGITNGDEPEPEPEDPTKDWRSYTSTRLGFSAKYPSDWTVMDDPDRGFNFASPEADFTESLALKKGLLIIISVDNAGNLTPREWLQTYWSGYSLQIKENLSVDGNSAALAEWDTGGPLAVGAAVRVKDKIYDFICYRAPDAGVADKNRCVEILKLMLGTVKFK